MFKRDMGIDASMGFIPQGIKNDGIPKIPLEIPSGAYDWTNGLMNGWNSVGAVTNINSKIHKAKVLQLASNGWGEPAFIHIPDSHTTGEWRISTTKISGNPLIQISMLSALTFGSTDWAHDPSLDTFYYDYGGRFDLLTYINDNTPIVGTPYNNIWFDENVPFEFSLKRLEDGTTQLIVNNEVKSTINVTDENLPTGTNIVIGAYDAGVIELNYALYTELPQF